MRKRKCKFCNEPFIGRPDKKYCDNYCRSAYHNDRMREEFKQIRNINKLLRKNRTILKDFLSRGKHLVTYERLEELGFSFEHITKIQNKDGKSYHYCYDLAYVEEGAGQYKIT